jgi:hypothetical protein
MADLPFDELGGNASLRAVTHTPVPERVHPASGIDQPEFLYQNE